MIKAIIFDFGDVFINLDIEGFTQNAFKHFKINAFSEEMIAFNSFYEQGLISIYLCVYSAGMPIYGQIQSYELTNILIVVVRYFGGIKLGVSGLINAYKTTAQLTLEASKIVEKTINVDYCITFDYKHMNKVMRIIKEHNVTITNQKLELDCRIYISVRKKEALHIFNTFDALFDITITETKC